MGVQTMADFYLEKKYNISKNNMELFISFGNLAKEYYLASKLLLQDLSLIDVVSSNISFSCELFIKAILYCCNIDYKNMKDKHNLKDLFNLLPNDISEYIKANIVLNEDRENFDLIIREIGNTFVVSRYSCERNEICINVQFLFAFADILNFVFVGLKEKCEK